MEEEDEVVEGFNAGSYSEKWEKVLAKEIRTGLSRRNPIVGLKQLLAFHTGTQAFQLRGIITLLSSIRVLVIINMVLMFVVLYFLFSK